MVLTYTLTPDNALDIKYEATSDAPSVINMTNHSYFNLNGNPNEEITNNTLTLAAANFTPVDSTFMTTGEILPVAGTPMDFTAGRVVGDDIDNFDFEQIKNGLGYDHNWVIDGEIGQLRKFASVSEDKSGRVMEAYTDLPGVQFYGRELYRSRGGKRGRPLWKEMRVLSRDPVFPDTANKPEFPSAVFGPGRRYSAVTVYKFV